MIPDYEHTNRPLSLVLAGQSIQRETLAAPVQTLYNRNRPNQALDGGTPALEVLNYRVPFIYCNIDIFFINSRIDQFIPRLGSQSNYHNHIQLHDECGRTAMGTEAKSDGSIEITGALI